MLLQLLVMRPKRANHWDSVVKEDPEHRKALYALFKSKKTEVTDFLYAISKSHCVGN